MRNFGSESRLRFLSWVGLGLAKVGQIRSRRQLSFPLIKYSMVEAEPGGFQEQNLSPLASPVAYDFYCDEVFKQWENEQDPEKINMDANNLLALALQHPSFSQIERLHAFIFVSDLTMERLRKFTPQLDHHPELVKQAEMIHTVYAQMYVQSQVELAKLVPVPQSRGV